MPGKALKHIIEQGKTRKIYEKKRVLIVAKKLHPHS